MGFAPDVSVMLNNFGRSNVQAGTAYCVRFSLCIAVVQTLMVYSQGLEALATNPNNGKTALIYIVGM